MKKIKLLFLVFLISTQIGYTNLIAQQHIPYRVWQFHKLDNNYVINAMKLAPEYDINTVVFSHGMIGETSQLFDGTNRGAQLKNLAVKAHDLGLKVWIWIHELDNVPQIFLDNKIVQLDKAGFWEWLESRYEQVFKDYPEFDGIMLTFHETQYKIFDNRQVNSNLSMPDRFAKLMNTINKVCSKYKKDFIVRTFVYEPEQLEWVKQGLLKSEKSIMVQTKCVPHDWDPYYPHNPLIGSFPDRKQIIEFDCSSEFTGKNRIPFTSPEYFEYRWRFDLSKPGVAGYNARLDHGGYDAIYTPNEINLYTLYRITQNQNITANDIWKEWTVMHYGSEAALAIQSALFPSFEVVKKAFFPLKFWITDHSKLPDFKYAESHITSRTLAKWIPDQPIYKEIENRLLHPDPIILEEILAEKDSAISLSSEGLEWLQKAKPFITSEQYNDLYWRLELLHRTAIIWKLHAEAFFGIKVLKEGHKVIGLKERIQRAINSLYREAMVSEKNPQIGDLPPASAKEIKAVADDLIKYFNQLLTTINRIDDGSTNSYMLGQNYPNPFNPTTKINYSIPKSGFVSLKVYNELGQEISTLVNNNLDEGHYTTVFNSSELACGIYYYYLQANEFRDAKKMIVIK